MTTHTAYLAANGYQDPDDKLFRIDIDLFQQADLYTVACRSLTFERRVMTDGNLTSLYTFKGTPAQWMRFRQAVLALDRVNQQRRKWAVADPERSDLHD